MKIRDGAFEELLDAAEAFAKVHATSPYRGDWNSRYTQSDAEVAFLGAIAKAQHDWDVADAEYLEGAAK